MLLLTVLLIALNSGHGELVYGQTDTSREEQILQGSIDFIERIRLQNVSVTIIDANSSKPLSSIAVPYRQISHDFMTSVNFWSEDNARDLWRELGVEWATGEYWWNEIERRQDTFDFGSPDWQIGFIESNYPGAKICASVMGVVHIYPSGWWSPNRDPPSWSHYKSMTYDHQAFTEYKQEVYDFAFNLVSHYKDAVQCWVTPTELNYLERFRYYGNKTMGESIRATYDQVVALHKVVARAIKDANPDALVILGGGAPQGADTVTYVDTITLARLCIVENVPFDAVGFIAAPYTKLTPADYYDYIADMSSLGKSVFPMLVNYPSFYFDVSPDWFSWKIIDEEAQAEWLRYLFMFSFGSDKVLGFGYWSFQDPRGTAEGWGLVGADGRPKRAYQVYKELLRNYTTSGEAMTDDQGRFTIAGYPGEYELKFDSLGYDYFSTRVHVIQGGNNVFVLRVGSVSVTTMREKSTLTSEIGASPWSIPDVMWEILAVATVSLCIALFVICRRRFVLGKSTR